MGDGSFVGVVDGDELKKYFINKGMNGGTDGNLSARSTTYAYVF